MPAEVESCVVLVTIYEAKNKRQNFGMVKNSFIRCYDKSTGEDLARFDLQEDYGNAASVLFGRVYRHNGEWKFEALGQGSPNELGELLAGYTA
jgi:tellurium resistance protein TerD